MAWLNAAALSKDLIKTTARKPFLSILSTESICQKDNQIVVRQLNEYLSHEA